MDYLPESTAILGDDIIGRHIGIVVADDESDELGRVVEFAERVDKRIEMR
jgi:hypothetical protein